MCHDPHWPRHNRRRGAACEHGPRTAAWRARQWFSRAVDGVRRERTPALSLEDERTRRIPLQLAQHPQFITPDRVNCGLPFFALRTCSAVLRPHSTCDHSRSRFRRPANRGERPRGPAWRRGGHGAQAWRPRSASRPRPASGIRGCASEHSAAPCRHFPKLLFGSDTPQVRHHKHFPLHPNSYFRKKAHSSESRTGEN